MQQELTLTVHTDLLDQFVSTREQNTKYQTNKLIKYVGVYYVLKSLTTSGVLVNWTEQRSSLCDYLNCTEPTLYKYLRQCEKLGYIRRTEGSIVLKSLSSFAESFDIVSISFTKIKLDYTQHKFTHVLEAAFLQVKEQVRGKRFEDRIKSLPELINELETVVSPDTKGNYAESLKQAQFYAFKHGHKKSKEIFLLNPFTNCNSKTLTRLFGFKSEQSIAYLKTKLQKNKLCKVTPVRVPSLKTQHVKKLFIEWDLKTKQTIWIQPDSWEYAPILIF